jgi:membrane associated rhomboid family serine protease
MILPIGDQPNPKGIPYVNYALIAVNVGVFLFVSLPLVWRSPDPTAPETLEYLRALLRAHPHADPEMVAAHLLRQVSAYDVFLHSWGYRPADPALITLLSSMFLHGGWLHLLGNMLFLWIYGDNVEHRLGRTVYLATYLATGLLAALGYGLVAPATAGNIPMVGASGAISGILGFYFIWFPHNKVRLLVLLFPFFVFTWKVGARWVLGFYLIAENLLPFLLASSEGGGVAYGAHLGGFLAGLVGALLFNLGSELWCRRQAEGCVEHHAEDRRGSPGLETDSEDVFSHGARGVERALRSGKPVEAIERHLELSPVERRQVPVPLVVEMAEWLAAGLQPDAALALYRRALDDQPRSPDLDLVFLGIGLVLLHGKGRPTAAYQYLMDALDADPRPEVEQTAREALKIIERRGGGITP